MDTVAPVLESLSSSVTTFSADTEGAVDVAVLTIDFSQVPTGFIVDDIQVAAGSVTDLTVDGSDATIYYANYTPNSDVANFSDSVTINAGSFTDTAGNSGLVTAAALSFDGDTRTPEEGVAQDGYIAGATVFRDSNGNGMWDEGEDKTTTDANGKFLLPPAATPELAGDIVMVGGTDISSGSAFTGVMRAPDGSTVVNALTTLVSSMMDADTTVGATAEEKLASAQDAIKTAFGIGDIDLTDYDPIQSSAAAEGTTDETAQAETLNVVKAMAQVNVIVETVSKTITGAVGTSGDATTDSAVATAATESVFTALASKVKAASDNTQEVVLNAATLGEVAGEAATATVAAAVLDSTAAAAAESKLNDAASTVATVVAANVSNVESQTSLTDTVKATVVATDTVASKLQSSLEDEVEIDTVALVDNLTTLTTNQVIQTIAPPTVTLPTDISGDDLLTQQDVASPLVLAGTATGLDGQEVTVTVGSLSYLTTVTDGAYSVTVPVANLQGLSQGSLTITADATDTNGVAASQVSRTIEVDTTGPTITSGGAAIAIDENIDAGQTIYTTTTGAGGVSYSLSGTDAALLSIDQTSGVVTLTGVPDYETQPSYSFTVVATDTRGNSSEQAVTLMVNDVEELVTAPDAPVVVGVDGGVSVSGLEQGASLSYSVDGGQTWVADTGADLLASSTATITLTLSGSTPSGGTPFSVTMGIPVGLATSAEGVQMAVPAGVMITPTATFGGQAVPDLGITFTNGDLDPLLSLSTSGSESTDALSLELATLVNTIANSGSLFAYGIDSILSSDGLYNLSLTSEDLAFTMGGERVDTVNITVPIEAGLDYPMAATLISDGVQLIDYDGSGDEISATLQSSYNESTDTLTYDLTNTGLGLNRDNLNAVLDGNPETGHEPTLKFQFGSITGTAGDINLALAGSVEGGIDFTIAFDLALTVAEESGVYTITAPGGETITPTATIDGVAVDLGGFTLSNVDMDQFVATGNAENQSPELTLKLESLLSQLEGNSTLQSAVETLLASDANYALTATSNDFSFTVDAQPVSTVEVMLPVSGSLDYPLVPNLISDGVQLIDYDGSGDANAATLQTSYDAVDDTLTIDLDGAGLGLNRTNLQNIADGDSGTAGTSPMANFQIDGLLVDTTVMVRQTVDGVVSESASLSLELDLTKTDFIFSS